MVQTVQHIRATCMHACLNACSIPELCHFTHPLQQQNKTL